MGRGGPKRGFLQVHDEIAIPKQKLDKRVANAPCCGLGSLLEIKNKQN